MTQERFARIVGTGSFLPGEPIPFAEIEDYLGHITDAPKKVMNWIKRSKSLFADMLAIKYCHYAIDPQTKQPTEDHVTMSVKAAEPALEAAGLEPQDVEFITFGSPFMEQIPPITTRIQEALGIDTCSEMAIHSNCTSAYKALMVAHDMVRNGRYKNALVISTCLNSGGLRADYLNQQVLTTESVFLRSFLCDGSGAVVLESGDEEAGGLFLDHCYSESLGGNKPSAMHNGWPAHWVSPAEAFEKGHHHMSQMFKNELRDSMREDNGLTIFTNGVARMVDRCGIDLSKLKFFQLNMPTKHIVDMILDECEEVAGIPRDRSYARISNMGYPGPPAALICLDKINREEELRKGDVVLSFVTEVSKFMQAGFAASCH